MIQTSDITAELLESSSCLIWADNRRMKLSAGVEFTLAGMPYLHGLVSCNKKVVHIKKGAQVCMTTSLMIDAIHRCYYKIFEKNIMYMMPTEKKSQIMSKVLVDPIFRYNPWLGKCLTTNTDTVKTINGLSIVFVGAQPQQIEGGQAKDSANLRSTPADAVYRDEIDLMDEDMVEMSKQRLLRSRFGFERNFGTPSVPGHGIDALYDRGDQRRWVIPCRSCGRMTCLVEAFPRSLRKEGGRWFRCCEHCQAEIYITDGSWETRYPDRREASFWISGLMSPLADLEDFMYRYHTSEGSALAEFERSVLGRATVEATCQLSVPEVLSACSKESMAGFSSQITAQGVDVGEVLHVVTGVRTLSGYKILHMGVFKDFDELAAFNNRMKVFSNVTDKGPDIHGVKKFQKEAGYSVYRCQYSESQVSGANFKDGVVKVNRNEACDKVHHVFTDRKIILPMKSRDTKEYALHLTKMVRTTVQHPVTGVPKAVWVKVGDKVDHFFHATGYFLLAADRLPLTSKQVLYKELDDERRFEELVKKRPKWHVHMGTGRRRRTG